MIMVVVKILSRFTSLILKETNTPEQILKLIHAITTKNIGSLCYHNTYKYVDSIIIMTVIKNHLRGAQSEDGDKKEENKVVGTSDHSSLNLTKYSNLRCSKDIPKY